MKNFLLIFSLCLVQVSFAQSKWAKVKHQVNGVTGYGIMLDNQQWLIQPEYDNIIYWYRHFSVTKNGKTGCMDKTGKLIIAPAYDAVFAYYDYILLKNNGKYGAASLQGKVILEPVCDWITLSGKYIVYKNSENKKWGVTDTSGNTWLQPVYEGIRIIDEIIFVQKGERWGALDSKRNYFIKPVYEDIGDAFVDDLLNVKMNGKWGYIDRTGKVRIPFRYVQACRFRLGTAKVADENNYFYINTSGQFAGTHQGLEDCEDYATIEDEITYLGIPDGYTAFTENGKAGIRNSYGETIVPAEYDEFGMVNEGIIVAKKNGQWGAIDFKGKTIIDFMYLEIFCFFPF